VRLFPRLGLRRVLVRGGALVGLGGALLALMAWIEIMAPAPVGSITMGLGMGMVSVGSLILIQESVGPDERGAVTASNLFVRNLGATLGPVMLSAVPAVLPVAQSSSAFFLVQAAITACSLFLLLRVPQNAFAAMARPA